MEYINPGSLFLQRIGTVEGPDDVRRYVRFLRDAAGIGCEPPVTLDRIFAQFGIPKPVYAALPDQQGLLLNPNSGSMIINDGDPRVRQRFTEAHELVELLFSALPSGSGWATRRTGGFKHGAKERLCNEGASELLMPEASFVPRLRAAGVSYRAARQLALEFEVSTTAALVRMTQIGPGRHAVVLWRMKNKPTEMRNARPANQLRLFGEAAADLPAKKLRVEWSVAGPNISLIPVDKSVPEDSSIYVSWRSGVSTSGEDYLDLANCSGIFRCENQPFEIDGETEVLSLLHLPGDSGCGPSLTG